MSRGCPSCHHRISRSALLCPACGAALTDQTAHRRARARAIAWVALAVAGWVASMLGIASYVHRMSERARAPADPIGAARAGLPACLTVYVFDAGEDRPFRSQGSGFLVAPTGLGVTCYHVLAGAARAEVRLSDHRLYDVVRVESQNEDRDVVLFQLGRYREDGSVVTPLGLKALATADSATVRLGDRVIAVGSPQGLENSLSDGLVSGIRGSDGERWIQFSAPISPGSSGGPLFDAAGRVVGIVTQQFREAQNLNFAVPVEAIQALLRRRAPVPLEDFGQTSAGARARHEAEDRAAFTAAAGMGSSMLRQGHYRAALEYYRTAISLRPSAAAALYGAARCLESLNEPDQAADMYQRFLDCVDPGDPRRARVTRWLEEYDADPERGAAGK